MKRIVLWAVAAFSIATAVQGCGGNACQDAFDKVKSCWSSVNCNSYPAEQRTVCQQSKSIWATATAPNECNNPEAILDCDLDSSKLCACKR